MLLIEMMDIMGPSQGPDCVTVVQLELYCIVLMLTIWCISENIGEFLENAMLEKHTTICKYMPTIPLSGLFFVSSKIVVDFNLFIFFDLHT